VLRFGRSFYKLSGSGNDFVAFDEMGLDPRAAEPPPEVVRALCRRGMGVGADGVVLLRRTDRADYQLIYYNADGTRATLCGNASLCGVRLTVELGHAAATGTTFLTDAGPMSGRLHEGLPEIDLAAATEVQAERRELLGADATAHGAPSRVGFARVGVPHVVILCDAADAVDVERVGSRIRAHPALHDGANVNYVSRVGEDRWIIRTYERGVEAETLACGTGSVASATLLRTWGEVEGNAHGAAAGDAGRPLELVTRSGRVHRVRLRPTPAGPAPSLAGAADIVFSGALGEGPW
jgi:diaminopimelate epimerase